MKIRTQLLVAAAVFGAVLLVIAASVVATTAELDRLDRQAALADRIEIAASDLAYLANEYLLYGEEQQLGRWGARYDLLAADLAALSAGNPGEQALIAALAGDRASLKSVVDDVAARANASGGVEDRAALQVAWSRVGVPSQALAYDAGRLSALLEDEADRARVANTVQTTALLGAFAAFVLVGVLVVGRRTLGSVAALQQGANVVGSGDLAHVIPVAGDDEIADLARSFNRMTADLAAVTASKADLEAEVERRTRAEAEARSVSLFPLQNPHPVLRVDGGGRILTVNPAARRVLAEWGTEVGSALPDALAGEVRAAFGEGTVRQTELPVGPTVFAVAIVPLRDEGYVNLYFSDVTERKRAEEALRTNATAVDASQDAIFTAGPDMRLRTWNQGAERIFGYTAGEVVGSTTDFLATQWPPGQSREEVLRQLQEQGHWSGELVSRRKDGSCVTTLASASLVRDAAGTPISFTGVHHDITERKRAEEALRENEERFRSMAESIPSILMRYDSAMRVVYLSPLAERYTGIPGAEFVGRTNREVGMPVDLCDRWEAAIADVFRTGTPAEMEFDFPSPDGTRFFLLKFAPERGPDGDVRYVLGVSTDITERKRAEAALRERERTLQGIFRAAPVGIGISSHHHLKSVNEGFCRITGYAEEELVGRPTRMLYPDDETWDTVVREKYARILADGIGVVETRWRTRDGDTLEVLLSSSPMDPADPYENVVTIALDLTPLREKEAALRESEARFHAAFEHSPLGMGLGDPDGRVLDTNAALEEMLGYGKDELRGMSFAEFTHPDDLARERDLLERVLSGEVDWYGIEKRYRRRDGRVVLVRLVAALFRDGAGAPRGWIAVHEDITDRKRAEAALRESEERYRDLVEQAGSIIIRYDRDGRLTFANEFAQRFFGYSAGELLGRTTVGTIIPGTGSSTGRDPAAMVRAIAESPGAYAENENENVTKDGRRVWVRWANRPIVGPGGEVREFLAIGTDITGRKAAEEALAAELADTQLLQETGARLIREDRIDDLYGAVLDAATAIMRSDCASLQRYRPERGDGGELQLLAARGFPPEAERFWEWVRADSQSTCGMALRERRRVLATDIAADERVAGSGDGAVYLAAGIRAVQTTPLFSRRGTLVGMLSTHWHAPHAPSERDLRLLDILARQAADLVDSRQAEEALRENEAKYRELFESMGEGFALHEIVLDEAGVPVDYRFLAANPAFEAMTGLSADAVVGRTAAEVLPGLEPEWVERYGRVATTGEPARFESHSAPLGRWFDVRAYSPGPGRFATVFTDVTRERQVAAALAESEAKYRHLFEHDITGDFIAALDGRILDCNPAFARMFGYASVEEALGSSIAGTYATPEDRGPLLDRVRREGVVEYDARFRRRVDGTPIHVVENILGRFDNDGTLVGTQGYIIEDTERHRAEEELRQSREWFRVMGEALPYGVWRANARGGAEYVSQSFLDLLEMTQEEQREFGWTHRLPPDEVAPMLERWMRCVETGEDWDDEHHVLGPDGAYHTVLTRGRPVRDRDGAIVAWVGINLDIDDRKRAEEDLREYAEELRRSNEDLERFAYVSSHDLQEPLRSIVSFSQLLERRYKGKLGTDADEYIEFIVEGGNRMQTLILDLLAYSRVNSKAQELRPTDAEAVMAAVERQLDPQLREAGATLSYDPLPTVTADPLQLEQVFANLVSNAVKFRREDEPLRVHVSARKLDGFWEFSVADNGIGIEPEYFEKIFVIFQRLHTKDAYPGTGIGLAIVKRIVDRHGGRVRVESTPGEGATFSFTLPAA